MLAPNTPGFYWAKWRIAADGTADDGGGCMGTKAEWEVVEVWENSLDASDPEHLIVHVCGVEKGQPLENFYWGKPPYEPLKEPEDDGSRDSIHHTRLN